jgi:hypothetical protein
VERFETKRTIGYHFFATADLVNKKHWVFNSSLGFQQKRADHQDPFRKSSLNNTHTLDYLSFANIWRIKLPLGNRLILSAHVGPKIDYLLNYSDNFKVFGLGGFFYYPENDFEKINIGLNSGVSFLINMRSFHIGAEASRNFNFNPVISATGPRADGLGDEGFFLRMNDRTYLLTLLLIWDFKKRLIE